ncbi:unnamed protein product, partial [marine sediment metagenome]
MKGQIPDGSITSITKPDAPLLAEKVRWWRPDDNPGTDMGIVTGMYVTYFDADGVAQDDDISPSVSPSNWRWEPTEDGMIVHLSMASKSITATAGLYYEVWGLIFGMKFFKDTEYWGGPDTIYQYPATFTDITRSSPPIPDVAVPMKFPVDTSAYTDGSGTYTGERFQYGTLRLVDVRAPQPMRKIDMTNETADATVKVIDAGEISFYFKFDFSRKSQQIVNYAISAVDQAVSEGDLNQGYSGAVTQIDLKDFLYSTDAIPGAGTLRLVNGALETEDVAYTSFVNNGGVYEFSFTSTALTYVYLEDDPVQVIDPTAAGKEGPPSEISDKIVVNPIEWLKLTTTRPAGYTRSVLYRGGTSTVYRQLDDDLEADTFIDLFVESLGEELPPYGNFPNSTVADAQDGSLVVGGHTAIVFDGEEVRPSVPYQFWTYPEEYAFPAGSTILAGVSFASSAVIFTDTNQYNDELGKVFR